MDINSIIASEINKNATVNTFTKGMNTDVADNMMPSDQYRLARNLRVITSDGSNGELRLIEGGKDITQFGDTILATTQIRDYGLLITENSSHEWSIWRYDPNAVTVADRYIKLFGSCADQLGSSISLVTRYEDDDNIKLYIADGKHPLMYIRVDKVPSTVSTDINYVLSSPAHDFGGFDSFLEIDGSLKSAAVQYAYILYNKYGNSSNLSPLSQLKPVTTNVAKGSGTRTGVHPNSNGTKGFQFNIKENKTSGFEKIKVFRITYEQIGQDPRVDIIIDDDLGASGDYVVKDAGSSVVNYSYSEFLGLQKVMIVPKEIESKNDYLFASNVAYQIAGNQDIITNFSNLDLSCQVLNSNYTNMNYPFNSSWESCSGSYSSFTLLRDSSIQKSLRRDEIYRYGVVLYDKYGNAWPVKFLCDLRTPPINSNDTGNLQKLKVRFTINWNLIKQYFGQEFTNFFTAFEIVRCKRNPEDRFTITQGIVGRVLECRKYNTVQEELSASGSYYVVNPNTTSTNILCPSGFMTTDRLVVYPTLNKTNVYNDDDVIVDRTFAVSSKDTVLFASPEICYQQDDVLNLVNTYKSDLQIKAVWQKPGLTTTGKRYFYNSSIYATVKFNIDQYNYIEGLNFLDKRGLPSVGVGASLIGWNQESNHQGSLWISSRLGRDVHEPLGYNQWYNASTHEQYYTENNSIINASYDISADKYFRSPNNVNIRKTIYNKFNSGFSGAITLNDDTICPSAIRNSINIQDVKSVNIPRYDGFANGSTFTFKNNTTSLQSYTFVPWSVPTIVNLSNDSDGWLKDDDFGGHIDFVDAGYKASMDYPISVVGKSLIIKTSNDWFNDQRSSSDNINLAITVCNIRKNNTVPYGGYTNYARENSTYYSFGDYYTVDLDQNGQRVIVTSGDCFIQNFRYNAAKTFYTPEQRCALNMSTVYVVPIESDIDMDNEVGWSSKYNSNDDVRYIQDEAAMLRGYTQTEPCYQANTAYNVNQTARYFTGQDKDSLRDVNYDYRVCYSNQKSNNESIDSWLNFKSANYIDVDTRYGQITNLRLFKDTLLFWQEQATGVLSVNERTMIQDANDTNIILGNGQVLQRYDYLTTQYGMKPGQFADGQSNTTLYWWDGFKKEILSYAGGQAATPMNKVKTIDNYIKNHYECSHPIIVHDAKYNEVLFNVVGNYPLAYSEVTQQFMSIYDEDIQHKIYFNDKTFVVTSESVLRKWNEYDGDYLNPYLKFVINPQSLYNNTFDLMQIGGNLYKNSDRSKIDDNVLISFTTPLKQEGRVVQDKEGRLPITDREYDYRFAIPRAGQYTGTPPRWVTADWGDRLRGKTMECELASNSDDRDFSLQYIITKYRKSWI